MAKQVGILPLEGRIENLTFYRTANGYSVQKVKGVSKETVATSPAFQRTRENMAEFARAVSASKLLRMALSDAISGSKDSRMNNRLNTVMLKAVKLDQVSDRGFRNVLDGELQILEGFDFNKAAPFEQTFDGGIRSSFNRVTGVCTLEVDSFQVEKKLKKPDGATHFRFLMAAAAINFETGVKESVSEASEYIAYALSGVVDPLNISVSLSENSEHPVMLAVTIEFVQEINGKMYSIKNGSHNACILHRVDTNV